MAMVLVVEEGVEALTVQRLAEVLDYTPGALYRYFPSMGAVLVALQCRVVEEYFELFLSAVDRCKRIAIERELPAAVSALARILVLAEVYREFARHRPAQYRLIALLLGDPRQLVEDDVAGPVVEPMLRVLSLVARQIEEAASVGALRPGDSMGRALLLWSGLQGLLQLRKLERFAPETLAFERLAAEMVRALLGAWGAREGDIARAEEMLLEESRERPLIEAATNREPG